MVVAVLGAGALGTLVAAALAAECEVRLLVRESRVERAIAGRGGVNVAGEAIRAVHVTRDPEASRGAALLIVAVKTYATVDALVPFRAVLPHDAVVLSLQNGIDAAAHIARALGGHARIALGPTTEAAIWLEPGLVRRTAIGATHVGWAEGHVSGQEPGAVAALLTRCGLRAAVARPIEPYAWAKLVVNAAINPVTALARVSNGAILDDAALRARAAALAREAFAVAEAAGIALPFPDPVAEAERVMSLTAANRSSMLQDLERGGPTEIEAISGAIVRRAATYGLHVPQTKRAYDDVLARAGA